MSIAIRPTVKDDVKKLAEIQQACEKHNSADNAKLTAMSEIYGRLASDRFKHFTIVDDEEIVGGVFYKCKGSSTFFRALQEGEYYLQRVCVSPDRQGEGIAHSAIKVCELYMSDAATYYVDFPTNAEQDKKLYEALGFVDTGRREKIGPKMVVALYEKRIQLSQESES